VCFDVLVLVVVKVRLEVKIDLDDFAGEFRLDCILFGYRRTFVATDIEGLIQRVNKGGCLGNSRFTSLFPILCWLLNSSIQSFGTFANLLPSSEWDSTLPDLLLPRRWVEHILAFSSHRLSFCRLFTRSGKLLDIASTGILSCSGANLVRLDDDVLEVAIFVSA
jgi:hypothetical protein